jgi:hypothetical protein
MNPNNLDLELIRDVFLVKFPFTSGSVKPLLHDITLLSVKINPDGGVIGTIKIHNSSYEIMDMFMSKSEYTNLQRQKKLKQIGI